MDKEAVGYNIYYPLLCLRPLFIRYGSKVLHDTVNITHLLQPSAVYVDLEYLAGGYGNVTVLVHHGAGDGAAVVAAPVGDTGCRDGTGQI